MAAGKITGYLSLVAFGIAATSCGGHKAYAGLTKKQAMKAAEARIVRDDYRGASGLFEASIWSYAARRTRTPAGKRAWLVKYYDAQLERTRCAYAWRLTITQAREIPCKTTSLGPGIP